MINMDRTVTRFTAVLSLCLVLVFGIHLLILYVNQLPLFEHKIILAYLVNYGIALGTYILLYTLRQKMKNQLGFLFLGTGFLKFILFFLLFYPSYTSDQQMSALEISAFFIPYLTSLIIEVIALTKLLNNLT